MDTGTRIRSPSLPEHTPVPIVDAEPSFCYYQDLDNRSLASRFMVELRGFEPLDPLTASYLRASKSSIAS